MSSSARRALKILAAIGDSDRPMGVSEIARAIGATPGTAFRGIDALQRANLLARDPSAPRYMLGSAGLALRQTVLSMFRIRDVCMPYLRQLSSASGETSSLHIRIGWYAARIATAPGTAEVTSSAALSGAKPLFADVPGRVILAYLNRKEIARHIAWLSARDFERPAELDRELAAIRVRGFARGPAGVAFPIRKSDQAFAAVAIEGPGLAHAPLSARPAASSWREIARAMEALVRANPDLTRQPFQHLDPDEIALPS